MHLYWNQARPANICVRHIISWALAAVIPLDSLRPHLFSVQTRGRGLPV
jgi:hypothetical protein